MWRFLSLGAGVQSSTLALMIAHGEVPMVDAAIFADTQWEPRHVYQWLDWLESQLPFPVVRVTAGSLRDDVLAKQNTTGQRYPSVPWHLAMPNGDRQMNRRQCTAEYKVKPILQAKRRLMGVAKGERVAPRQCETLLGISTDEVTRMRDSREAWNRNVYPLVDARMSRQDCKAWMAKHGYPEPPKSSCIGCPYHSNDEWRKIKADSEAWADAVAVDAAIREPVNGMVARQYMHRSLLPLLDVDLTTAEERGQTNLFENDCEGMCGV
ncbi:hypothetical protein EBR44_13655 [bacterium]|nr:hypothetical protein [bacterium]